MDGKCGGASKVSDKTDEQTCKCDGPTSIESHACPYAVDIEDDYTDCMCCDACQQTCADDV